MKNCFLLFLFCHLLYSGQAQNTLYRGAIDSTYFFHVRLLEQGEKLSGQYRYDNHDQWIDMDGTIKPETGEFVLYEYAVTNGERKQHGVFKGIKSGAYMGGNWMMLDGKNKKLPFYFYATNDPEARTFHCSSKTFFSNKSMPVRNGKVYTLIPDDQYGVGSVIWFDQPYHNDFTIEFEYRTWDDDGDPDLNSTNSADGLSLILFQDKHHYEANAGNIPNGGARGFIKNGSGIAVQFVLYGDRSVQIVTGNGDVLASQSAQTLSQFSEAPTGPWSTVSVTVQGNTLTAILDEGQPLTADVPGGAKSSSGFGIGAGTGGADALHQVKNVRITRHKTNDK